MTLKTDLNLVFKQEDWDFILIGFIFNFFFRSKKYDLEKQHLTKYFKKMNKFAYSTDCFFIYFTEILKKYDPFKKIQF